MFKPGRLIGYKTPTGHCHCSVGDKQTSWGGQVVLKLSFNLTSSEVNKTWFSSKEHTCPHTDSRDCGLRPNPAINPLNTEHPPYWPWIPSPAVCLFVDVCLLCSITSCCRDQILACVCVCVWDLEHQITRLELCVGPVWTCVIMQMCVVLV